MQSSSEHPKGSDVTRLFEEFVAAEEDGRTPDVQELYRRAGEERAELERRIEVYASVQALSNDIDEIDEAPASLARFQVLSTIGEGGGGRVYLAFDPDLGRRVALKVLDARTLLDRRRRAWVLNEARSLARLVHPGIVRVFEVGQADGRDYVVMEHLRGPSLSQVIEELRRMRDEPPQRPTEARTEARVLAERLFPFSARAQCLRRIASALAYSHDRGVLHRDVKPSNVLFDEDGAPKLIDFGLAHLREAEEDSKIDITHTLVGTPAYIAPEQIESGETGADPRSDQFSFCVLAYELLALKNPFQRETRSMTFDAITYARPTPLRKLEPVIPADLATVVEHGLERAPEDRYGGMEALEDDLAAVCEHRTIAARRPSLPHALRLWTRRNRRQVVFGGGALTLVLAAAVGQWASGVRGERGRALAELEAIQVAELQTPRDFEDPLHRLAALRQDVARFEAGLLSGWLAGGLEARVEGRIDAVSRQLSLAIAADGERGEGVFQFEPWVTVLHVEDFVNPGCPHNAESHARGKITIADELAGLELRLVRQEPLWTFPTGGGEVAIYRPVALHEALAPGRLHWLAPGAYRLVVAERGATTVLGEVDFVHTGSYDDHKTLGLPTRDESVYGTSRAVPRIELFALAPFLRGPNRRPSWRWSLPAYRVTSLVTGEQLARFLEATGRPEPDDYPADLPADAPAYVSHEDARAFATWAGGRLPTVMEVHVAELQGIIALPERNRPEDGEHVGDLPTGQSLPKVALFHYGRYQRRGDDWLPSSWYEPFEPRVNVRKVYEDGVAGQGFRVVFPADVPGVYEELYPASLQFDVSTVPPPDAEQEPTEGKSQGR